MAGVLGLCVACALPRVGGSPSRGFTDNPGLGWVPFRSRLQGKQSPTLRS